MAEPVEIRDGDIVQVQRVELYYARVERAGARDVVIQPLDPRIADRRIRLSEITRVFREIGHPLPRRCGCGRLRASCASTGSTSARHSDARRRFGDAHTHARRSTQ